MYKMQSLLMLKLQSSEHQDDYEEKVPASLATHTWPQWAPLWG